MKSVVANGNSFLSLIASGDVSSVFPLLFERSQKSTQFFEENRKLLTTKENSAQSAEKKVIQKNCLSSISGEHKMANRINKKANFVKRKDEHGKMSKDNYYILQFLCSAPILHLLDDTTTDVKNGQITSA